MSNRHRLLPLLPYLVATATVTLGVALAPSAHADDTGALCTTDADCAALGYTGTLDHGVTEAKVRLYSDRYELAADDAADPVADCLTDQGYRGIAGDGQAAIYAPAAVIEGCAVVVR